MDVPKPYFTNSPFQIEHFISGTKHTPEAKYVELVQMRNGLVMQSKLSTAQAIKHSVRKEELEKIKNAWWRSSSKRRMASAELLELEAQEPEFILAGQALTVSLNKVNQLMFDLEKTHPHLKSTSLIDLTIQLQENEWMLEFQRRAENFHLCHGVIPPDHLAAMRAHPGFQKAILPKIQSLDGRLADGLVQLTPPQQARSLPIYRSNMRFVQGLPQSEMDTREGQSDETS